ncbi:hypothetical protein ALQ93_200018 [Pseudomonas syringae pv. pisi]|uniref:hypothetical protein n=1 Tax=Pseudomonas syringae group TaxID=136849 RepID=UPI000EFF4CA4|nr:MULTISPECIES: hypothetical protein [Pseudomonas syringae group]RML50833.1 hypothetical protein ALQ93_200018 [Pseudomonas syringae pv. pisi]
MSAEQRFRDAFKRLIEGKPVIVSRGCEMSQNNVAREAGLDPSALKKSRFPQLVAELQEWIKNNSAAKPKSSLNTAKARARRRTDRELIKDLKQQRDQAASALLSADLTILQLHKEIQELKSQIPKSHVLPLRGGFPQ